jgi:hypothetical protein
MRRYNNMSPNTVGHPLLSFAREHMNINNTLVEFLSNSDFSAYGCLNGEFCEFLGSWDSFLDHQNKAIRLIEKIMTRHGKELLLIHVIQLAKVEMGIRQLEPWVRDHVVHALLTYILGIYVNERFLKMRNIPIVNTFQWKIAGMFHDVGYPIQIAKDLMSPFADEINQITYSLGFPTSTVSFRVVPIGLEQLQNGRTSLGLFQSAFDNWQIDIDAQQHYQRMINTGDVCHGIISAMAIIHIIDLMYQKHNPSRNHGALIIGGHNWNESYFENDVVPACAAIFLHNLPSDHFMNARINADVAPLPFLLRLCDTLQDWGRPSQTHPKGLSPKMFDIDVQDGKLIFHVQSKEKIEHYSELLSPLQIDDILTIVN